MKLVAGKVSVTAIIVVAFVLGLAAMALTTGKSPSNTAGRFMAALADGDSKTLAELSYADGVSRQELEEQWAYTMDVAATHFQFTYEIKGESMPTKDSAIVWMMYVKNAGAEGTYDERWELPLVKADGEWKIDVYAMNREMFPGLPRG